VSTNAAERPNWDQYFLGLAKLCASRSKDPSTQTGAVIVDADGRVVSTGYNGFAQPMPDKVEYYEDREEKYSRIIHCEMNALIFAQRSLVGCTVYTWPLLSCDRCAVHLVQAGIRRFVSPVLTGEAKARWEGPLVKTRQYLEECGVECEEFECEEFEV
jgi:dCMP deaminase